jgi:NitT/TauT family transport system substrate-binding protein
MSASSRAAFLATVGVVAGVPWVARAQSSVVRIGAAPTDATAQPFYAKDLGMFGAAGLTVEITPLRNTGAVIAAAAGGSLDVITGSIVPIAEAHHRGIELRTFALGSIYPPPNGWIVVPQSSAIRSGADLNGKTVSANGLGDTTQVSIQAWIDATGGNSKNVKLLEVPFPGVAAALAQGRVDAAILVEPFMTAARGQLRSLGDAQASIGKRFMSTGWFAKPEWLSANRDTARRFIDVMAQSARWANRFHNESAEVLARYLNTSPEVVRASARPVYGETAVTAEMLQPLLDAATKYINLPKTSASDLIWRA